MNDIQKPIDTKVKVKPIFGILIHRNNEEGPCRFGSKEELDPKMDEIRGEKSFKRFCSDVKKNLSEKTEMLNPVSIKFKDNWIIKEEEFRKLESDSEKVDLYLVGGNGHLHFPGATIGERYKEPVALIGDTFCPANLRAENLESYGLLDYSELNHLISLLQIRKALKNTRILRVLDREISPGIINTHIGLKYIKEKFGMDYKDVPIEELAEEIDKVDQKKVEEITDRLIEGAEKVHMERKYIIPSVSFYLGVKNLMREYSCNAFTTDCFEICPDGRVTSKIKAVPCLAHSLLKDEGIPSACEGDISALLTMVVLMCISKKSIYMGNLYLSSTKNIMRFGHNVPGLKMKGFDKPDLPYEIRNFTVSGWGVTIHYDFSQDKGEKIIIARFNPLADKILVIKGEIEKCDGFGEIGCRLVALVKVRDSIDIFHKSCDFGRHFTMVYGDYIKEIKELGKIMNFEVVEA